MTTRTYFDVRFCATVGRIADVGPARVAINSTSPTALFVECNGGRWFQLG